MADKKLPFNSWINIKRGKIMCSVITDVKFGGLYLQAEIMDAQALKTWYNQPPGEKGVIRATAVRGTRPGPCVLFWRDANNKLVEIPATVL